MQKSLVKSILIIRELPEENIELSKSRKKLAKIYSKRISNYKPKPKPIDTDTDTNNLKIKTFYG